MIRAQKTTASYHTVIVDIIASRIVIKAELPAEKAIFVPFPDDVAVQGLSRLNGVDPGLTFTTILLVSSLKTNFLTYLVLLVWAEVYEDTFFLGLNEGIVCVGNTFNHISSFVWELLELLVNDQTIGRKLLSLLNDDNISNFQMLPKVESKSSFLSNVRFFGFFQRGLAPCPKIFSDQAKVELVGDLLLTYVNDELDDCSRY